MSSLRLALAGIALGFSALLAMPAVAQTLLPAGFFDRAPVSGTGRATIEADVLSYDATGSVVTASGDVLMTYEGYAIRAQRLTYNQSTTDVSAEGGVEVTDPNGSVFQAERVDITGNFARAVIQTMSLTTVDGSLVTAGAVDANTSQEVILDDATYSPCGLCIDAQGRRIGWRVKAQKIVYVRKKGTVELTQPSLELLGMPVAWVPWLSIPDPSQPRLTGFRLPRFDYSQQMGATVDLPYFWAIGEDTDVIFTPRLMSRQGALFAAEVTQRFPNGEAKFKVSGLYQIDKAAFAGTVGDRDWRGAIQTSGYFIPYPTWVAGWSYTAFTDAAFLTDYRLQTDKSVINEVWAVHLSPDYYADLRLQQYNLLGNVTPLQQEQHAKAIPNLRGESIHDLPDGWGQLRFSGNLLGVQRGADHTATYNGVPYVFAYRETKYHAMAEASWQKQWIGPAGIVVTPYAGLRLDGAWYDGASPLLAGPVSLLSATPIAAIDVRWPLAATDGISSYIFEPIAQLVYRGSSTTAVGITNDNAQSFVFDDTNLFSYNRFSGSDRQETGLRANIGGRYQANFADGSWLDLIAGQSFHLAGTNGLGVADAAQTGLLTGLGTNASYIVAGAKAGFDDWQAGAKVQLDPNTWRIARAGIGGRWSNEDGYSAAIDYIYLPATPTTGVVADQHEVSTAVGAPLWDYWSATAGFSWDIARNSWLDASAGVLYDDDYLAMGLNATVTGPTHTTPNDIRVTGTFKLSGPGGTFGF